MRLRIRYFILVLLIAGLIGYSLGCCWPIMSIMYSLSDDPVSRGQNLSNFIAIISALFTLAAVVVALFKDEIIGQFKCVELSVSPLCNSVEESLSETQEGIDPTVLKFFNQVVIENKGNVNALDCELLVESIKYKSKSDIHARALNIEKKLIPLGGQDKTYIPKDGGKREAPLVEIMSSADPDGNNATQLLIAGNPVVSKPGDWEVGFCLNMSNASLKRFVFLITWDGQWHDHKGHMQIEVKQINEN